MSEGVLMVCATPIGNLDDISDRLRETLESADVIYAEDTRRTSKLLRHLGIDKRTRSLFAGNESSRTSELIEDVRAGKKVALVSDAGMPTISDPGADAVRQARQSGLSVSVVPGPSAVTMAIALSGMPGERFVFEGFLPRKASERVRQIELIASDQRPVVIFASPHRLVDDLEDLAAHTGADRVVVVNREMTKLHEETWAGTIGEAIAHWDGREVRGELTLVLAPGASQVPDMESALAEAMLRVASGAKISESARGVAEETGVSRRELYERLIASQEELS